MTADHILLIHGDPATRHRLQVRAQSDGYLVSTAADTAEAALVFSRHTLDIIICEGQILRGRGSDFLEWAQERIPSAVVVVLNSWMDFDAALEGVGRAMLVRERLLLPQLERQYPGITRLKRNASGFLILGER